MLSGKTVDGPFLFSLQQSLLKMQREFRYSLFFVENIAVIMHRREWQIR